MEQMYNTKLFNDIFPDAESFYENYTEFQSTAGLLNLLDETDSNITWQLLSAKYGNNPIANFSEEQFKLKIWQIMFQYGPTWVKRLDIQHTLRTADIATLREGQKYLTNTALNPDQTPSTEEVSYINQQNVSKTTQSIMTTYGTLWELLKVDVNSEYLDKFKDLFLKVVIPRAYLYETDLEED